MANDLKKLIAGIVAQEIDSALTPYRAVLEDLVSMLGGKRGPGRPRGHRTSSATRSTDRGDASTFQVGQAVSYKQGRGDFEATVVSVELDTNTVTVQRDSDGKEVSRPASKISAATGSKSARLSVAAKVSRKRRGKRRAKK